MLMKVFQQCAKSKPKASDTNNTNLTKLIGKLPTCKEYNASFKAAAVVMAIPVAASVDFSGSSGCNQMNVTSNALNILQESISCMVSSKTQNTSIDLDLRNDLSIKNSTCGSLQVNSKNVTSIKVMVSFSADEIKRLKTEIQESYTSLLKNSQGVDLIDTNKTFGDGNKNVNAIQRDIEKINNNSKLNQMIQQLSFSSDFSNSAIFNNIKANRCILKQVNQVDLIVDQIFQASMEAFTQGTFIGAVKDQVMSNQHITSTGMEDNSFTYIIIIAAVICYCGFVCVMCLLFYQNS